MSDKKKILVVDDEPDVRSYLELLFKDNGFDCLVAGDGREGFALTKSAHPDLICLDITMPEESGVRMYRNLYENESTKGIPVIIVTGVSGEFKQFIETRRQVPPPAGYFEKPIDRQALLGKVRELLA